MVLFGQYLLERRQRLVDLSRISEHSDEVGVTQMVLPALAREAEGEGRSAHVCMYTCM